MAYQLSLHKGPAELELEILKAGLCTVCGACLGLCPYFRVRKEKVILLESCGKTEGRCYEICPRTRLDLEDLNQKVFGRSRDDFVLGTHTGIFLAQSFSKKIQAKAQYGGVVTGLISWALSKKIIDGAILVGYSTRYSLLPEPALALGPEQVLACAGSKYTSAPSLKILDYSLKHCKKLAFVGRACQVEALRKRIVVEPEIGERIALIVGLFCMWSLDYRRISEHLAEKMDLSQAKKFDIPYNRFVVYTGRGKKELDFEPIKGMRRATCDICYDFTAELADLSVGSTEWKDDWNTLIVRSERGRRLVERAKKARALRLAEFPEEREALLRNASLGKKQRVVKALFQDKTAREYLAISDKEKEWIANAKPISGVKK